MRSPSLGLPLLLLACASAAASRLPGTVLEAVAGPLADAQCNLETVERANKAQLHELLSELATTPFFRLINVNMDGKCQYWGGPDEEEHVCESKAEPLEPASPSLLLKTPSVCGCRPVSMAVRPGTHTGLGL